jgi:hypothetical protein
MSSLKNVLIHYADYGKSYKLPDIDFCRQYVNMGEDFEAFLVPRLRSSVDYHDYDLPFMLKCKHLGGLVDLIVGDV